MRGGCRLNPRPRLGTSQTSELTRALGHHPPSNLRPSATKNVAKVSFDSWPIKTVLAEARSDSWTIENSLTEARFDRWPIENSLAEARLDSWTIEISRAEAPF